MRNEEDIKKDVLLEPRGAYENIIYSLMKSGMWIFVFGLPSLLLQELIVCWKPDATIVLFPITTVLIFGLVGKILFLRCHKNCIKMEQGERSITINGKNMFFIGSRQRGIILGITGVISFFAFYFRGVVYLRELIPVWYIVLTEEIIRTVIRIGRIVQKKKKL